MAQKKDIYFIPEGSPVYPNLFDKRVVSRNLASGKITQKQLDEHLKNIPDESDTCDKLNYDEVIHSDNSSSGREMKGGTTH
ncbi:MAG: hypothetical protein KA116_05140 [Proteobacteria bacterium]|jgi:hypothetical protein|nr:hypothetical protein [Pseudomonadota bacterium]